MRKYLSFFRSRWGSVPLALLAISQSSLAKSIEVDFATLPEDGRPAWSRVGAGSRQISDSTLLLESETEEAAGYIIRGGEDDYIWDGEWPLAITFEARAFELPDPDLPAAHLVCRGEGWRIQVPIEQEEWLLYQIKIDSEGNPSLQIGQQPATPIRMILDSSSARTIAFGDLGRYAEGTSQWRKLEWSDEL